MKKYECRVPPDLANERLDQAVFELLGTKNNFSKSFLRKLIVAGAVYLNNRRVRIASKAVNPDDKINVFVRAQPEGLIELVPRIAWEDEDLLVLSKPAGLPSQPTLDRARENAFDWARRLGYPKIALHHRLDKDTSGLLLLCKNPSLNKAVGELFSEHRIDKNYWAIVHPEKDLPPSWTIDDFLGPRGRAKGIAFYGPVKRGGLHAVTDFHVIAQSKGAAWIEAKPRTGRTHQIRAHLASQDLPIHGDWLYGSFFKSALMLHAEGLTFTHPRTENVIELHEKPPQHFEVCQKEFFLK